MKAAAIILAVIFFAGCENLHDKMCKNIPTNENLSTADCAEIKCRMLNIRTKRVDGRQVRPDSACVEIRNKYEGK